MLSGQNQLPFWSDRNEFGVLGLGPVRYLRLTDWLENSNVARQALACRELNREKILDHSSFCRTGSDAGR